MIVDKTASWRGDKNDERFWLMIFDGLINLKTLKQVCDDNDELPSLPVVAKWAMDESMPKYQEGYKLARKIAAELRVDTCFQVAENASNDWDDYIENDSGEIVGRKLNQFSIQRAKLVLDTTKWFASKMLPKLYGDKLDVSHGITGDLAKLISDASNKVSGLPPKIDE